MYGADSASCRDAGAIWAINTGRSVDLLEKGLTESALADSSGFHSHNRTRRFSSGTKRRKMGAVSAIGISDARAIMPTCFRLLVPSWPNSWISLLNRTKARLIYNSRALKGSPPKARKEMDRITISFGRRARVTRS
jgi:hypothetical protein